MSVAVARRYAAVDDLTGHQKAAIVLMALGPENAAEVTKNLGQDDLEEISLEIARLEHVPSDVAAGVLAEWEQLETAAVSVAEGGVDYARRVLEKALGAQKASVILKRIESQLRESDGFHNLRYVDPEQVSNLVRNEHPQTIALLLGHLESAQTAAVVKELPTDLGGEVLYRLARMEKVLPEVLQVLEKSYGAESALALSKDMAVAGGPESVAAILNQITGPVEKELLDNIGNQDPELCEQIKNLMFVFEDIVHLNERALQRLLREVQTKELALALKATSEGLREKIVSVLSGRAADALREEIEFLGPVRVRDVETAQGNIVKIVHMLEEQGEISIGGAADEMVV